MASGRPDFHPTMLLEGKHDTQLIPVLVDAAGQLYIVMTGSGGLTVNLDAAGNIIARLQGYDGAALKDVKVDDAGNLISRMKGYDGAALQDVKVDDAGYMLAKMTGLYDATLKTVAVDADGIMKANLSVQDLNYLKVRPVYGQEVGFDSGWIDVADQTWVETFSITGRGAVIGGHSQFAAGVNVSNQRHRVTIDDVIVLADTPASLDFKNYRDPRSFPLYSLVHDPVTSFAMVGLGGPSTFETSYKIDVWQITGVSVTAKAIVYYALVP